MGIGLNEVNNKKTLAKNVRGGGGGENSNVPVIEGVLELFDVYGVILPSAQPQPQPHEVPTPGNKCMSYESFDLPLLLVCL